VRAFQSTGSADLLSVDSAGQTPDLSYSPVSWEIYLPFALLCNTYLWHIRTSLPSGLKQGSDNETLSVYSP
jgi:hypothetical protein